MHTIQQRIEKAASGITQQHGGILRCESCGHTAPVEGRFWRDGWPKHCGYTMRWWTERQFRNGEVPPVW